MKFEYVGGVVGEQEKYTIERFETDVLPYISKHGPRIGESAMNGDEDALQVMHAYRGFTEGMPDYRPQNLKKMIAALKRWEAKSQR